MSPVREILSLEQDDFDRLLQWLDPDPERAGRLYERVRWRLITILASRGCAIPEELADETIDRVARKVAAIQHNYVGDKAIYFLGVMNNVHHEYLKRPMRIARPITSGNDNDKEALHACLDDCLEKLAPHARLLIERYYAEDRIAKITSRKRIAQEFGINLNTLRLRALRIREKLQICIEHCLHQPAKSSPVLR